LSAWHTAFGLSADWISTSDAKQQFFLDGRDLTALSFKKIGGGFGCGAARRFYQNADCLRAAEAKHGRDGLVRKREARVKREANKRKREEVAADAEQSLERARQQRGGAAAAARARPCVTPCSAAELKRLRKDVKRALKPKMTWEYVRPSERKEATVQLGRVQQEAFAALIGRGDDPALHSLVKHGAWYSFVVSVRDFFPGMLPLRGTGGVASCNRELGIDSSDDVCVKYCPSNETLSVSAEVMHVGMHSEISEREEEEQRELIADSRRLFGW
jgi:hypothetical protein